MLSLSGACTLADEGNECVSLLSLPRSFLPVAFSSAFLLLSPTYAQSFPRDMQGLKSGSESNVFLQPWSAVWNRMKNVDENDSGRHF